MAVEVKARLQAYRRAHGSTKTYTAIALDALDALIRSGRLATLFTANTSRRDPGSAFVGRPALRVQHGETGPAQVTLRPGVDDLASIDALWVPDEAGVSGAPGCPHRSALVAKALDLYLPPAR